jgi:hypothetical protein
MCARKHPLSVDYSRSWMLRRLTSGSGACNLAARPLKDLNRSDKPIDALPLNNQLAPDFESNLQKGVIATCELPNARLICSITGLAAALLRR